MTTLCHDNNYTLNDESEDDVEDRPKWKYWGW